jgi:tetratricopeptide (TPR) repeat protein
VFLNGSPLAEERMQLIQVLYRNARGGPVDDITLDELIRSRKITHFYRPSEDKWVDIFIDPVRERDHAPGAEGLRRRYVDKELDNEQSAREEKSSRLLSGVFRRLKKHPPCKALTAREWLERGLSMLPTTDGQVGAARAFALSIRLNPQYQDAYLHRGLVYEALGNLQQAIEDYTMAIALDPKDKKTNKPHGLGLGRPEVTVTAIAGLKRAADLQRTPARTVFGSPAELRKALEALMEPGRDEEKVGDARTERAPMVARNLRRLIEKYAKEITQLEVQFQGVKDKHGILVEAVRLLEEEELPPHGTPYEKLAPVSEEKT